jgi:hypothetical protein
MVRVNQLILAGFVLMLLACAPITELLGFTQNQQAVTTLETLVNNGDFLALSAYQKLHKLPGYQLEARHTRHTASGESATRRITITADESGNRHVINQSAAGQIIETYMVAGRSYFYSPQYQGWISPESGNAAASLPLEEFPHQWFATLGVVPTETGREEIAGRPATRYNLKYIMPELASALGQSTSGPVEFQGTLWVDDETGAVLKSEILLFEANSRQPSQEFVLQITQVGGIEPINAPAPVVDPGGIVAATATAQAWSALRVTVQFEGQPVSFDLIPAQIRQSTADTAEMQLELQNLPPEIATGGTLEAFLVELGSQIRLSLPQKNLTASSTHFQLTRTDLDSAAASVSYFFKAELEDFSHAELILSAGGNPVYAPVPVVAP